MEEQIAQQTQEQQQPQPEQYSPQQPEATNPETEPENTNTSIPEDAPAPEVTITEDGEIDFKDSFFGISEEPQKKETDKEPEKATAPTATTPPTNLYSPEELSSIPFENWDRGRLPSEIASYYDEVRNQLLRRQRAEQIRNTPMPNVLGEEPKPYTPKELIADANKLAMERLGVKEDDFDPEYDAEHRAAVDIAKSELLQQRNYDVAAYKQRAFEVNELMNFNAGLANLPDYDKFASWYVNAVQKAGKTNEQIQRELLLVAQQKGCREVIRIVSKWYNDFRHQTFQQAQAQATQQTQATQQQTQTPKTKIPPKLESSQGGNTTNRKTYDMRNFGQLDDDAQAQALIDMGIV